MRVKVENEPKTNEHPARTCIRLWPENNEEMAQLEWIRTVGFKPKEFVSACNMGMWYGVTFKDMD